jgi:polyphosphate kinase
MEGLIRQRRKGNVIRLEIRESFHQKYIDLFRNELEICDTMIYKTTGPVDYTFCFALASELSKHINSEVFPPFKPYLKKTENYFESLKQKAFILHHPYDSFDPVIEFLKQAAEDPGVLAIKQTLYRSSGKESKVVKQLLKAVENGKQVTVLLELKARFDEEKNIEWAKKLEEEGVHVIYGVQGLKTHAKILLVVRKEENGLIRRYMHFGTGNYNEKTASLYTDISFFTASIDLAYDASNFFNYLTGYSIEPSWRRISISPSGIKNKIIKLIDNEIAKNSSHSNSLIIAKMNSLLDAEIIEKLYEASNKGVKIKLIVRGICGVKAGVKGLSENIEVHSIVGRFLEHSRIFYFKNAGEELVFISSADWMPRNLERRVELMIPIDKPDLKKQLIQVLDYNLKDNLNKRILNNSSFETAELPKAKKKQFNCHEEFIKLSNEKTKMDEMQSKETLSTLKTFT